MGISVAVAGASGYVGAELLRLLVAHPEIEIGAVCAGRSAGATVGTLHPHLPALADRELLPTTVDALAGHDVVFLALPHGHSATLAAALPPETLVLDCGADHRLVDPAAWTTWYGGTHAGSWPYGLPELPGAREALRTARRVAVPGCYPTAATLAIAPALTAGLVEPDVVVVAASGTSGAGKDPKPHLTSAEVMGAMSVYGAAGAHRHTPEIAQNLGVLAGAPVAVSFTPMLAPMSRGILATVTAPARQGVDAGSVRRAYTESYLDEPFVRVLPDGHWPHTGATLGGNRVDVQAGHDPYSGRVVAVAAIDNLTKGSAGGAVQCMNIALGLAETAGLPSTGVAP